MLMDSLRSTRGMAVAPHALASQSALAVLRENGNALEAMIAAAATIAVVYRRMNSIGGDAFWLMHVLRRRTRNIRGGCDRCVWRGGACGVYRVVSRARHTNYRAVLQVGEGD